jgi:transcriptional regulator with XRE-family HTH domain
MQDSDKSAIIDRVKLLRTQYAGKRGKNRFASALRLSPSTYNYYESSRIPPIEVLLRMCEVTGADLRWLLTGQAGEATSVSKQNTAVLHKLDGLLTTHPELTEAVLAFVELLCEKKQIEAAVRSNSVAAEERPSWIPVLGRTAAGILHFWDQTLLPEPRQAETQLEELVKRHIGRDIVRRLDGRLAIDLQAEGLIGGLNKPTANLVQVSGQRRHEIVEFVQCKDIHKAYSDSFALRIDGDSMSPRINDGDIVMLSPSLPARQGQVCIARVAEQIGVTCKLIRTTETQVHLIPINERYQTRVIPKEELLWALAVLCHISL